MSTALASSIGVVAYLALFAGIGLVFLFVTLLIGRFVRPANPFSEKLETYECGEPSIGSSFVQFDLRFYVVALLFIIFDVEVALFFPWATVFGKSTHLMDPRFQVVQRDGVLLTDGARRLYQELGVRSPSVPRQVPPSLQSVVPAQADAALQSEKIIHAGARQLALLTIADILVFFAVLLVGFAYVWRRGDLDWVRAASRQPPPGEAETNAPEPIAREPILSA